MARPSKPTSSSQWIIGGEEGIVEAADHEREFLAVAGTGIVAEEGTVEPDGVFGEIAAAAAEGLVGGGGGVVVAGGDAECRR